MDNNFKITSDQGKESASTSRTSNKPAAAPRSDKDFRKIMGEKDSKKNKEQDPNNAKFFTGLDGTVEYEEMAYVEEEAREQQPTLFDLSKGTIKKSSEDTEDVAKMASSDELPMESPTSIFKNLALKEKSGKIKDAEEKLGHTSSMLEEDSEKSESKTPTRFPQESIDLTYVNPLALNTPSIDSLNDKKMESLPPSQKMTIQQIMDAVVKAIATVETQGKTDTVVTLKQPPMFAGANLILTSFETAKGEFNIRFENLQSPEAQLFMNMQQNQDSLRLALQEKGYVVHILVATTQIELPQAQANAQQSWREGNPQQQQQQGRGRQQEAEEEEA